MHVFRYSGTRNPNRFILYSDKSLVWHSRTGIVADLELGQPEASQCQLTGEPLPYTMIVSSDIVSGFNFQELPVEIQERLNILHGRDTYTVDQWLKHNAQNIDRTEELGRIFIALGHTILETGAPDFQSLMASPYSRGVFYDKLRDSGIGEADVFSILEQAGIS